MRAAELQYTNAHDEDDADSGSSETSSESGGIDESVREDMLRLEETFEENGMKYRLIDRIGEGDHLLRLLESPRAMSNPVIGTFSTVYKAEDLQYQVYHNEWDTEANGGSPWLSPSGRRVQDDNDDSQATCPGYSQTTVKSRKPRFVAIKKIYVTSSPLRIQNELELLHILKGSRSICPLITAFRHQDQVVAILPHFRHQDFRVRSLSNRRLWRICVDQLSDVLS